MLVSAPRRLIAHWELSGSHFRSGSTEQAIQAFEERYQLRLPADFREYLSLSNGVGLHEIGSDSDMNHELIAFWSLDTIISDHDELPSDYFAFADFLINSVLFVIHLSADIQQSGTVGMSDGDDIVEYLSDSFSGFVEAYLHDPASLVPHS
jgi:hypothetical protein